MNNFHFKTCLILGFVFIFLNVKSQTLIMNEVSNGISGSGGGAQEYVEFVVVSNAITYTCTNISPPCIDIRGWIFDDNSGYHGPSGIATGAIRFSQDPLWSCLPLGTIILIYNGADKNPAIPTPDDLSLSDGNCRIIADVSNTALFDKNSTTPGAAACSYPATGWVSGGTWANTALANSSDCARIVNLAGCEVFSVCYGTADNVNNLIYFSGTGTGNVYYFNGVDPQFQSNWSVGSSSSMQTPGAPNNTSNAAYIAQFNNGCMPITQTSVTAVAVNAGCTCNGSATASASGSIGGYTYVWYDASMNPIGQTSATATGLCAGVYNVIATSHIGCTATISVTINSSSTTSVTINSQTICAGASAILTATPSTAGGTFSWTPGGQTTTSITVSPSSTTTYSVTYTLAGCSGTNNGIITVKPLPTVTANSSTICSGQAATLTANGGTSYIWNTGSVTNTLSVLPISNTGYTVTGTTNGCSNTAVSNVIVKSSPTITVNSPTICSGQTATLTASGATTYTWNTGSTPNPLSVSPTSNSIYTVTGTTNGCTNTAVSNVSVTPLPAVTVNSPTICLGQTATITANGATTYTWNTGSSLNSLNVSPATNTSFTVTGTTAGCTNTAVSNVSVTALPTVTVNSPTICLGQTATITANGATTYVWNTGSISNSLIVSPTTNTIFIVIGTTNGCANTAVANVVVNSNPTITVNPPIICAGQVATLTASGASSYSWNTGATTNTIIVSPISTTNYTVLGILLGCTNTAVANVSVNPTPTITVNSTAICSSQAATLTANGATTYIWNTGSTTNPLSVSPTSNSNYTVIGTTNGCTNTAVSNVSVTALPTVTVNSPTICSGQTATLTAIGATTYIWNTGATLNPLSVSPISNSNYTVTETTNGCSNTAVSSVVINSNPTITVNSSTVCAGLTATLSANGASTYTWNTGATSNFITDNPSGSTTYTVVGESFGCINTAIANIIISSNLSLSVNTPTICAGQTTTLTSLGAITYTWSTGAVANNIVVSPSSTTSFSVLGTNGICSGSTIATVVVNPIPSITVNSSTICAGETTTLTASGATAYLWDTGTLSNTLLDSPISSKTHTVVGTTLGCSNTAIAIISVTPLPTVAVNSPTICVGQTATITATGANNYSWNTGSSTNSISIAPTTNTNFTVIGLANGCTNTAVSNVSVTSLPVVSANSPTICAGQIATITANGATTYIWSTGSSVNPLIVTPTTNTLLIVTGFANGCSNTATTNITVNPLPVIVVNSPTICSGQTANVVASGASSYTWNTGSTASTLTVSPSSNTSYTVNGILLGCANTLSTTVSVVSSPILSISPISLCSGTSGSVSVTGASSYSWSNGSNTSSIVISPLVNTTYSVIGSIGTCSSSAAINVTVNPLPTISVTSKTICAGESTTLTANGASSYIWNNNNFANSFVTSPNVTTIYTVTGTTANCSSSTTATVVVNKVPAISFSANQTSGCSPLCVQFADLTPAVSSSITNWNWIFDSGLSSNLQNPSHCFDNPGSYTISLLVTMSNGCSKMFINPNMINVFPNPIAEFSNNTEETDILNPIIEFTNLSSNANSYEWNFGDNTASSVTNPSHTYNLEGTYSTTLIATNHYECKDIMIHDIVIKGIFTFYAPNTFTPNEDNINDIFLPLGVGWNPEKYQLDIFDRWGNNCFNTNKVDKGWDGKANHGSESAQIDTYTWKVDLTDVFDVKHKYIGKVTLLR